MNIFKQQSSRAAPCSAAIQSEQPISEILKVTGWKSDWTFAKFYDKPIMHSSDYAGGVLTIPLVLTREN